MDTAVGSSSNAMKSVSKFSKILKPQMWRASIPRSSRYKFDLLYFGYLYCRIDPRTRGNGDAMSSIITKVLSILDKPPTPAMNRIHGSFVQSMRPLWINTISSSQTVMRSRYARIAISRFNALKYRGVSTLIGINIGAYMFLNSRYMKTRSSADGLPRSDRHFIASRYNLSQWRVWSVPLSTFNHGDSLMQLIMNCFGLAIVGPAVELAFGPALLISGFMCCSMFGALAEVAIGNHWCRGSSAGVTGLLGISSFANPYQLLSIWGMFDVRAASLVISIFGFESLMGLLSSKRTELAHIAHAGGISAAIPFLYYLRWYRRF